MLGTWPGSELAWATTWGHTANTMIGPAIGLPTLPVIECVAQPRPGDHSTWKYAFVARYAGGRPLAWFDDDFDLYPTARDVFLDTRQANGAPTNLVRVNPRIGLTAADLASVETWLLSL